MWFIFIGIKCVFLLNSVFLFFCNLDFYQYYCVKDDYSYIRYDVYCDSFYLRVCNDVYFVDKV